MIYLTLIISFIKKHWLVILLAVILGSSHLYMYSKGKRDCEARVNRVIIEEQLRHQREIDRLSGTTSKLKEKIKVRINLTDKEYSCILSNNPIRKDCLK